jgi:hypothetical protein
MIGNFVNIYLIPINILGAAVQICAYMHVGPQLKRTFVLFTNFSIYFFYGNYLALELSSSK